MKVLPTFYYLNHFDQILAYISGYCASLLDAEQEHVLRRLRNLPKLERALMARLLGRKVSFVIIQSLNYPELDQMPTHLSALHNLEFIRSPSQKDLVDLIPLLNKAQLLELSASFAPQKAKQSWPKAKLLAHTQMVCSSACEKPSSLDAFLRRFVHRILDTHFNYFLFLFFGHTNGHLSQFSLRDLNIIQTQVDTQARARFDSQEEAWSCYYFENALRGLKQAGGLNDQINHDLINTLPKPIGQRAQQAANRYLFALASLLMADAPQLALALLEQANSSEAFEKRIRLLYKQGQRDVVQNLLEAAVNAPESDEQFIFAEDFLARKFEKKKCSIYTDLLLAEQNILYVDESAKNRMELTVVQQYRRKGSNAWRTENAYWRSLFGLLFWDLLFEDPEHGLCNEFDRHPKALIENRFWEYHQKAIIERLSFLDQPQTFYKYLTATSAKYYGKSNCIFRWHRYVMDRVRVLLEYIPKKPLKCILEKMCQDYTAYKDGFPDIAVLEGSHLVFEELKAPGDSLRKNQLVTIRAMQAAGLTVRITRVELIRDYNARYAVVDIEATGGARNGHRITEIGIVILENQQIVETWSQLINPQRHIPQKITALTGITNAMVVNQPTFSSVANQLKHKLEGCIFVAHNVNFDYGFIQAEFQRLEEGISLPKLCTVRESRRQFPGLPSYSLANLSKHFTICLDQHHRALADAQAAADILLKVFEAEQGLNKSAQTSESMNVG